MIDVKENELLNAKLDTLYKKYTSDFLDEWEKSFSEWIKESKEEVPYRMNEFGIVNIQNYDKDNGVLFVAKETNNWENKDFKSGCLFRGWLSNIVEQGYIGQGVKYVVQCWTLDASDRKSGSRYKRNCFGKTGSNWSNRAYCIY